MRMACFRSASAWGLRYVLDDAGEALLMDATLPLLGAPGGGVGGCDMVTKACRTGRWDIDIGLAEEEFRQEGLVNGRRTARACLHLRGVGTEETDNRLWFLVPGLLRTPKSFLQTKGPGDKAVSRAPCGSWRRKRTAKKKASKDADKGFQNCTTFAADKDASRWWKGGPTSRAGNREQLHELLAPWIWQ